MNISHVGSRRWCVLLACLWLLLPPLASAETKTLTAEGTYTMGDGETPLVAEIRALQQAKRIAIEQAGTYVQSYSKAKQYALTDDEIEAISAGLIEVEILDKTRQLVSDGLRFSVKIKATVTVEKADELVSRLKQKSPNDSLDLVRDYKKLRDDYARLATDMDTLKRQMVESKNAQERQSLLSLMVDQERKYEARERYGRCQSFALLAIRAIFNGSASEAGDKVIVECLDEVIRLDPNFADAWGMRGMYREAREREGSIADYTEAIRLDPQPARYHARGVAFELLSIDRKRTDSREASSLHNRALMDAHEAIRLDGQAGNLYQWRGVLNYETGKYSEALSDYTNAIRLNADTYKDDPFPETGTRVLEALYADRGLTYMRLGQYQQAVADFTKRLQLIDRLEDQFNGLPWVQTFGLKWRRPSGLLNRGKAYSLLKRDNEAMRDYRVACALGDPSKPYLPGTGNVESKEACDLLKAAEGVSQR